MNKKQFKLISLEKKQRTNFIYKKTIPKSSININEQRLLDSEKKNKRN